MAYSTVDYGEPMLALGDVGQIDSEETGAIGLAAWGAMAAVLITGIYQAQVDRGWIPQMACVCLAVLWLIVDVFGKRRGIKVYAPHILLFLMILWEFVCNLFSSAPLFAMWGAFMTKSKVYAASFVVANIVRTRRQLLPTLMGCAVLPVIILVLFRHLVSDTSAEFATGAVTDKLRFGQEDIGNTNALARDACYALPGAVAFILLSRSTLVRLALIATIPATLLYVGYTGSRSGMATVVLQAVAFWFFYLRRLERFRGKGNLLGIAVLIILVSGAIFWIATSPFAYRFEDVGSKYEEGRFQLMMIALKLFAQSPVFGWGTFGYGMGAISEGTRHTVSHNLPSHLLAVGGLPQFLFWYGAWGVLFLKMWRLRNRDLPSADTAVLNMCFVLLLGYHAGTMTGSSMNPRYTFLVAGAILGYVYGLEERLRVEEQTYGNQEEPNVSLESDWDSPTAMR